MLKITYAFFIGILLSIFVGVGIGAFYPAPQAPSYHTTIQKDGEVDQQAERDNQDRLQKYDEEVKVYSRNVSIITLIAATIFVTISLVFEKRIHILADGVMLGGIFTLIYSIGRSFVASDNRYTFVVVTVGLIIAITLGYLRFIRPEAQKK